MGTIRDYFNLQRGWMNMFDWFHDVTKGEDTLRPKLVKVSIVIIVFIVLSIAWGLLRNILH